MASTTPRRSQRRRPSAAAHAGSGAERSVRQRVASRNRGAFTVERSGMITAQPPIPKIETSIEELPSLRGVINPQGVSGAGVDALHVSGALLGEVGERLVLSFLPFIPDRVRLEAVSRRWRRASQHDVPVAVLDFDGVKAPKQHDLLRLLERADGALRRLVLPNVRISDAVVQVIQEQSELRALRAYRLQKKHLFAIAQRCSKLESLELLDCADLHLTGWKREFAPSLQEIWLRRCFFLSNNAVKAVLQACGATLKNVYLTGVNSADSQVLRHLARYATQLEELAMTHGRGISRSDLEAFVEARALGLRWLDLTSCPGISSFPVSRELPRLQVLILDKTQMTDEGLQAIASVAPSLKYLSLQDCRQITDAGLRAVASQPGCVELELLDLKGTRVTDESLLALESACPLLRMVRLDSCRSVSRDARQKYDTMVRDRVRRGRLNELEQQFMDRQRVEVVREASSSSDSADEASDEEFADSL